MDAIQKVLIEAGRKDLAQEYYKKSTWMISVDDDHLLNEYKKEKESLQKRIEYSKKQIKEITEEKDKYAIKEYQNIIKDNENRLDEVDKIIKNWKNN